MTKTITKIDAIPKLATKKRVAAYARVSSGKDAMLHSLAQQVHYYKHLIQSKDTWDFIGVYADEAITGTKDSRTEFQQLLKDCRDGKIDMIITKSISRFTRNTVTLLETVRALQEINVDVFFEEENIHSNSGEGEMILTFLATFAQEESRSASENMKWRIKKNFEEGLLWGGNSFLGYKLENKRFILVPKEAEIVQSIFLLYTEGHGADTIGKILDAKGIKPKRSSKWNRTAIMTILSNPNYTGDLVLQKTFRDNHLTKRKVINTGELNQYIVKEHHEAIISKALFDEVQRIKRGKTKEIKPNDIKKNHPFKGMVKCGICGRMYIRKTTPSKHVWKCSLSVTKGLEACVSKQVPDSKIIEASNHILSRTLFDENVFKSKVASIVVKPMKILVFHLKDGTEKTYQWHSSRSESWTPKMREQASLRALNQTKGRVQSG